MDAGGTDTEPVSYGRRLADLAAAQPDAPALTFVPVRSGEPPQQRSFRELDDAAERVATALEDVGAGADTLVALALPHGPAHVEVAYGAWKLGATVVPLNAAAPDGELASILDTASSLRPVVLVGDVAPDLQLPRVTSDALAAAPDASRRHQGPIPTPSHMIASGGSTGRPKLIDGGTQGAVRMIDGVTDLGSMLAAMGLRPGMVHLLCTPLHHTSGFSWVHYCLLPGDHVVLLERFDVTAFLDAVERHRANHTILVPAIMQRLAAAAETRMRDLSSLEAVWHGGAVCPDWLKRFWIDLVGPEAVYEAFGATENNGSVGIRGDEWLEHPGSVGRPVLVTGPDGSVAGTEVRIVDEDGAEVGPGVVGEIYMRPAGVTEPPFRYVGGAEVRSMPDGFTSLGDLGWLDDDGYLYIADRRVDMIITGGANVFAAEVEAAVSEHPDVVDVVAIGIPDERWGRRVHAIVEARDPDAPPAVADLNAWARSRLAAYKAPRSYEFVSGLSRSDAGKMQRQRLVDERSDGWTDAMLSVES